MTNQKYKLIVFDLGGTIFTKGKQLFIKVLTRKLRLDESNVRRIIDGPSSIRYRIGEISEDEYWQSITSLLPSDLSTDRLKQLWFQQYKPIEGMPGLVMRLRNHYMVHYFSNNFPERVRYLNNKYNFLSWFDDGFFSYEVGALKSDIGAIKYLRNKYNFLHPSEILIIDDNGSNLLKLSEAGFATQPFINRQHLEKELTKLGVLTTAKHSHEQASASA